MKIWDYETNSETTLTQKDVLELIGDLTNENELNTAIRFIDAVYNRGAELPDAVKMYNKYAKENKLKCVRKARLCGGFGIGLTYYCS